MKRVLLKSLIEFIGYLTFLLNHGLFKAEPLIKSFPAPPPSWPRGLVNE